MSDDVLIELSGADLGPAESAALTDALRREILGLREVEGVTRPSGRPCARRLTRGRPCVAHRAGRGDPAGGRAGHQAGAAGQGLAPAQPAGLARPEDHRRRHTLELSATTDQQDQLVEQYLATLAEQT